MRQSRLARMALGLAIAGGWMVPLTATTATAAGPDGFTLEHFRVAPTAERVFGVAGSTMPGHLDVYGGLWVHYQSRPLVQKTELSSGVRDIDLVADQMLLQASVGVGIIDRLAVELSMPLLLSSSGEDSVFTGIGAVGVGDLGLTVRSNLYGTAYETIGVGANLHILMPTGDPSSMAADGTLRLIPEVVLTIRGGPVVAAINLGVSIRATETGEFRGLELGHELVWGVGASVEAIEQLSIGLEFRGRNALSGQFAEKGNAPIEVVLGPKITPWENLTIDIAGGIALAPGYGASEWRIVGGVSWAPGAPAVEDSDKDGILDDVDQCLSEPEDKDDFEDGDGCPEDDNDQDGVKDTVDRCPLTPQGDGFLGCPKDKDSDGDKLMDAFDRCPTVAEGEGGRAGCPAGVDTDGDGKEDFRDRCPGIAESKLAHGCPADYDSDGDKVGDAVDKCPYVLANTVTGCPTGAIDSDGDGLLDEFDACPLDAAAGRGCPPDLDSDGDGLLDVDDPCPEAEGIGKIGCPDDSDSDKDGYADDVDRCPYHHQGDNGLNGCPFKLDSDGDGLLDMFDKCPKHKAKNAAMGCPDDLDTDGDGLLDELDRCPRHVMGPNGKEGCPETLDRDKDQVLDMNDRCPLTKGEAKTNGCPAAKKIDVDRDGIDDSIDKCPNEKEDGKGAQPKDGCAAGADLVLKDCKIEFADSVFFSSGKDSIKAGSAKLLEDLSRLVTKAKATELIVEGHTDSKGGKKFNQKLSERRAAAVVAKLKELGMVNNIKLTAKGLGSSQPLADNKTGKGRAKNRRVEFRVVGGKCAQPATP